MPERGGWAAGRQRVVINCDGAGLCCAVLLKYCLMNENECFERLFVLGEICPDKENCETLV